MSNPYNILSNLYVTQIVFLYYLGVDKNKASF